MGRKVNKNRGDALKKTSLVALGKKLKLEKKNALVQKKKQKALKSQEEDRQKNVRLKAFKWQYHQNHKTLLVGEGNCSFARALLRHFKDNLRAQYALEGIPVPRGNEDMNEDDEDAELDEDEFEDEDEEDADVGVEDPNFKYTFRNIGKNLLVTCFDSQEVAMKKYDDLPEILSELLEAGAHVVFGVDATKLYSTLNDANLVPENRFDRIVFNFPHVGLGITDQIENIEANQSLILGFLVNALPLLRKPGVGRSSDVRQLNNADETQNNETGEKINNPMYVGTDRGGQAIITVKEGEPYNQWRIPVIVRTLNINQLKSQNEKEVAMERPEGSLGHRFPKLKLDRSFLFSPEKYEGYEHRRTIGFKRGLTLGDNKELASGARTYVFSRAPIGHVDTSIGLAGNPNKKSSTAPKSKKAKSGRKLKFSKEGKKMAAGGKTKRK